jgi:hypothetical protein
MPTDETISHRENRSKEIHCECGNIIKYDDIELNCNFPAYGTLTCGACSQAHRIIIDGTLGNLVGARVS